MSKGLHKLLETKVPRWMVFLLDNLVVIASIFMAFMLRFNFQIPETQHSVLQNTLIFILGFRFLTFFIFKIYSRIVEYTGPRDVQRIFFVVLSGSLLFALVNPVYYQYSGVYLIPYSIIILEFGITLMSLLAYRLMAKMIYAKISKPQGGSIPIMIFGAGEAGIISMRALESDYKVLGFFDDAATKANASLNGVKIYPTHNMQEVMQANGTKRMVLSVQHLPLARKQQIIEVCVAQKVEVLNVPPVSKWINGELSSKQIRKVRIENLLGREEIKLSEEILESTLQQQVIMVTGAAGSIGQEIAVQVAAYNPKCLLLIDQAETPLFHLEIRMHQLFPNNNFSFVLADVCDTYRMCKLFSDEKPNFVFHAAAYKHVPLMESNPVEAVRVNVLGTKNIVDLSVNHRVQKFVMVSTDKAVNPTNVMGASKRMAEMYVQAVQSASGTQFITTRFGNVLGSNGSVIPLFESQIEKGGPLTVTHPKIRRYFMTIAEACSLVLEAACTGEGGQIYVFDMGESVKIADLAEKMIRLSGLEPGRDIEIKYTGLRPGEKLYEELLSHKENTTPTHHKKIMIARVQDVNRVHLQKSITALYQAVEKQDTMAVVLVLKQEVKEYKSKNSPFEILDVKK